MSNSCRSCIILVAIFMVTITSFAQKRANVWYFGDYIGIDFGNTPPATLSNSSMRTVEGCASICDVNGNLLFYTDGSTIWDKTHSVMSNGTGLLGDESATQSGVIIPYPGNNDKYYVFTVDEHLKPNPPHRGFNYSIVDMTKNSGNGAVTVKNVRLLNWVAEKVTGVMHCNSGDIWVVTHGWNNNLFYSYLVTSTGLDPNPVISAVGSTHSGIPGNATGYLKASPDGTRLACAIGWKDRLQLFDFNAETGQVSNTTTWNFPSSYTPYGVEFSPNGNVLYVSSVNQGISQIDLSNGNIYSVTTNSCSGMQLAPNGKIYVANQGKTNVASINNPNNIGAGCSYNSSALSFTGTVREGLPSFNQSLFANAATQFFTFKDTCLTDSTQFNLFSSISYDSLRWDFGDTSSASNTSTGANPKHYYSLVGDFNVELKIYNRNCPIPFILKKIVTIKPGATVSLRGDTTICDFDSIYLRMDQKHALDFLWYNGNRVDSGIYVHGPGTFSVTVNNDCNADYDEVKIDIYEPIDVDFPDYYLCVGDTILLNAGYPNATYRWHNNSRDSTYIVRYPGDYWVDITTECYYKRVHIKVKPDAGPPNTNLGRDTMICTGDSLVLNASYLNSVYSWNTGERDSAIVVHDSGVYVVKVIFSCYVDFDSITVGLIPNPEFEIGKDTSVCENTSYVIQPESNINTFVWMDGTIDDTYEAVNEGWYSATASNACGTLKDSLFVFHDFPPNITLPFDTSICVGYEILYLDVSVKGGVYEWQDGSNQSFFSVLQPGGYHVKVRNSCGIDQQSIDVREEDCQCTVYFPNTFTPNGDDFNAGFGAHYDCDFIDYRLTIVNRWGDILYVTEHPDAKWDGTMPGGQQAPIDVYVYKINYTAERNEERFSVNRTGTINLIR